MYEERFVAAPGVMLELAFRSRDDYRLACRKGRRVLVEFSSARRTAVRSVEQLRYDFEKAVDDALRPG